MTVCTLRRSVNGGWMLTSTSSVASAGTRYDSFWIVWIASKWLRCIFQLPEISGRRRSGTALPQGLQAGQVAELEQFKRSSSAGGDVVHLIVERELGERRRRVT